MYLYVVRLSQFSDICSFPCRLSKAITFRLRSISNDAAGVHVLHFFVVQLVHGVTLPCSCREYTDVVHAASSVCL